MAKKPYPSEVADRYIIRMPAGMRDRIADLAKLSNRSMNAEIITRLDASISAEGEGGPDAIPDHTILALAESLARLNVSLAEREYELQLTKNYVDDMSQALQFAYSTIKNSQIEHQALDCLEMIEEVMRPTGTPGPDQMLHQQRRDEKLENLRLAQKQVEALRSKSMAPVKAGKPPGVPITNDKRDLAASESTSKPAPTRRLNTGRNRKA